MTDHSDFPTGHSFPDLAAQWFLVAFVPNHRCGTVPDSHQVPSCDAQVLISKENSTGRTERQLLWYAAFFGSQCLFCDFSFSVIAGYHRPHLITNIYTKIPEHRGKAWEIHSQPHRSMNDAASRGGDKSQTQYQCRALHTITHPKNLLFMIIHLWTI